MKYKTKNEKETIRVAKDFSKTLQGGELVLLFGDLGAGKTVFVKALGRALGIKEIIKSPTFNIMKCYSFDKKYLCHIDAYRLENLDELMDIGIEDFIDDKNIVVIEWAERVKGIEGLSKKIIKIKIDHSVSDDERVIRIDKGEKK